MIDLDHKDDDRKFLFVAFSELWSQYATFGSRNKMFDRGGLKNLDFKELGGIGREGLALFFHWGVNI